MKKQIKVTLYKTGQENDFLTRLVANFNAGLKHQDVKPEDIQGYFAARNMAYLTTTNCLLEESETDQGIYMISEDGGETFTMSLEWAEVYELGENLEREGIYLEVTA